MRGWLHIYPHSLCHPSVPSLPGRVLALSHTDRAQTQGRCTDCLPQDATDERGLAHSMVEGVMLSLHT